MKNLVKKSLLFAAFALIGGTAVVPTAQAVITRVEDITPQNIVGVGHEQILKMIEKNPDNAKKIAKKINRKNFARLSPAIFNTLSLAHKKCEEIIKKNIGTMPNIDNDPLEIFLYAPEKAHEIVAYDLLFRKNQLSENSKKSYSSQFFLKNYPTITSENSFLGAAFHIRLQKDQKVRTTLFEILKNERNEYKKGRYSLYNGRNSQYFVGNQVFMYLLEIFLGKPINKETWYTQMYHLPGRHSSYKNARECTARRDALEDISFYQFFSDLLGANVGSSALDYVLKNTNEKANNTHLLTVRQLFEKFNWGKYYSVGADEFKQAENLAKKFKYGTMLVYSLTPQALKKFVTILLPVDIDGKRNIVDVKQIHDTTINQPDKVNYNNYNNALWWHEYWTYICDDHPTDETKLGTASPYNQDIRIKHFNFGDDAKIAQEIKELIKIAFMKIKYAMIKDGVIKKNSPILQSKI